MSKQKWEFTEHSKALADTGDYDYYVRFTNGRDILQTSGCELEENQLREFCNLLDAMPDLWSHKLDATEFENIQLKKQVEQLKLALEKIATGAQPYNEMQWAKESIKCDADIRSMCSRGFAQEFFQNNR